MEGSLTKFIDVEKVLRGKSPALAEVLPGFVLRWLKRTIHEDEINDFLQRSGHLYNLDFVRACMHEMGARTQVLGLENVPPTGGCIVAANHPLGGLDGIGLMDVVGQRRPDIRFFVNDLLLHLANFGDIFVGVNKHGKNARENVRLMDEVFASDHCVLFFPAGLVSRRQQGRILDLEWQKSFLSKATRYRKPIIPTYIGGENSSFFYNLAIWRKCLRVKANVEMLFLPDEMYKQRNKTLQFVFGKPISPEQFDARYTHQEWAQILKAYVYALGQGDQRDFLTFTQDTDYAPSHPAR